MFDVGEVRRIAVELLAQTSSDTPMRTTELVNEIVSKLRLEKKDASKVYPILRDAAKEPNPPFSSRRGPNGGYFRKTVPESVAGATLDSDQPGFAQDSPLEKHLWPLVAQWLKDEKKYRYASSDHANEKSGGKWGNPDVVGLNLIDDFGLFAIEVATVEVKSSLSAWRQWIFEAVSHKRFSERVYFAVRTNDPDGSDINDLASYSEKYGIGLLTIDLNDDFYKKLVEWDKISDEEKAELVETIRERVSAPFEDVSVKEKVMFIKRLGFKDKNDLVRKVH